MRAKEGYNVAFIFNTTKTDLACKVRTFTLSLKPDTRDRFERKLKTDTQTD